LLVRGVLALYALLDFWKDRVTQAPRYRNTKAGMNGTVDEQMTVMCMVVNITEEGYIPPYSSPSSG